jgi:hypothetical protein
MQSPLKSIANCFVAIAATVLAWPSPTSAQQAQNSYTAFVTALAALAASADDLIANERNAARRIYIRQLVTDKVLAAFPASDEASSPTLLKMDDVLDRTTLLCKFRSTKQWTIVKSISARDKDASITLDQLATIAQQNYLGNTVRQLNAASTPADTSDLFKALRIIFAPPTPSAPDSPGKLSVSDKDRGDVEAGCEQDLNEFEASYYGKPIPVFIPSAPAAAPEAAPAVVPAAAPKIPDLSFLGPIGAAITTGIGIITPVIEGFAAIEANSQAEAKVKNILRSNQKTLTPGGEDLGRTVSDYLFSKRLSLAGQFTEQIALVQGNSIDLTSKEVQAACPRPAMYMRGKDGKGPLAGAFVRCYSLIWTHFEKSIDAALQAAQAYDKLADAGNTSTPLNKFREMTTAQNYEKIVANSFSQNDNFWQEVTQLVTFAGAVATATSPENLKKLEQSFQAAAKNP